PMQCPECKLEVSAEVAECPHCGGDLAPPGPMVRARRRGPLRATLGAYGFLLPNIVGFLAFTLLPVFAALALSFFHWDVIQPFFPEDEQGARAKVGGVLHDPSGDHARFVGLDNYGEFLGWERDEDTGRLQARDRHFWKYMYNTVFLLAGIPVGMVMSLLLALLMNQKLKGIVIYRTIYFLPSICVPAAVALLWMWLLDEDYGLLNSLIVRAGSLLGLSIEPPAWIASPEWSKPALILVGLWVGVGGYNCILYLAGLQGIPAELYEAAEIDGAGWWHRLRHITWPMLSPTTFFIFVMSIIAGFQGGFTYIHMMTEGGPAGSTTTIIYYIYQHAFQWFKMGRACALAMILFVIVFAITLINWRYGRRAVHYQ
ncbi:MAG: ABC transporter permease subunit, partial [Armatimonadota bacterium]